MECLVIAPVAARFFGASSVPFKKIFQAALVATAIC